ncbi:MAG: F0F1 ATP synthase subunit A, partial [Parcubacteria group bacterium]
MSENQAQINNMEAPIEGVSHESTIFAEPIFHIGSFTVTNSLLSGWITVFILVTLFLLIGKKISSVPKGLQNIFEIILEEAFNLADSVTGNRQKTEKFLPIALTLFLFILINNWLGLLPGVGTVGFIEGQSAHSVFVPLFRGATADLNMTLALSLFV